MVTTRTELIYWLRNTAASHSNNAAAADMLEADDKDAARYRWLRTNGLKYSFDHQLIGLLLSNKTELDAAMKGEAL